MLINEVVNIVGLSRKSIRYYESEGLLNPKRNKNNDYRIYTEEDIKKLKIIKFLRELDVSIKELKLLNKNQITLQDCMADRISKIKEQEKNYNKVKNMCIEISKSKDTFNNINIDKYFKEINKLNREGFTMRNINTNNTKKILGAIISSSIFELFLALSIGIMTYFQITETDKIPWPIYIGILLMFVLPFIGIIINLIKRINEIKKGEEDEASKY